MTSIEQQRQRVEQEMTKMVDELDKTFLRKMQVWEPVEVMLLTKIFTLKQEIDLTSDSYGRAICIDVRPSAATTRPLALTAYRAALSDARIR